MGHCAFLFNTGGYNRLGPVDGCRGTSPGDPRRAPDQITFHTFRPCSCPHLKYENCQLRSSSAYGPGGSSKPGWPPGRALDWEARAWRRWMGCRSPSRWWMSLKEQYLVRTQLIQVHFKTILTWYMHNGKSYRSRDNKRREFCALETRPLILRLLRFGTNFYTKQRL